jgi:hypothetical protein
MMILEGGTQIGREETDACCGDYTTERKTKGELPFLRGCKNVG